MLLLFIEEIYLNQILFQYNFRCFLLYLHVSLQLLQQRWVLVQPHEGLTETGGQGQDPRHAGSLALHKLV